MEEALPTWIVFPGVPADEPHTQGAVDTYIECVWLPYWRALGEDEKAAYLDRHGASDAWREAIAFRYEWNGIDEDGDPIWKTPSWLPPRAQPR
jgi:hypothetical protein